MQDKQPLRFQVSFLTFGDIQRVIDLVEQYKGSFRVVDFRVVNTSSFIDGGASVLTFEELAP